VLTGAVVDRMGPARPRWIVREGKQHHGGDPRTKPWPAGSPGGSSRAWTRRPTRGGLAFLANSHEMAAGLAAPPDLETARVAGDPDTPIYTADDPAECRREPLEGAPERPFILTVGRLE